MSDIEDNFDAASITPLDDSGNHRSFFQQEKSSSASYCLLGDVERPPSVSSCGPVKQFRTYSNPKKRSSAINLNEDNDEYITLNKDFSQSIPNFSSKPLTSSSKYVYNNNNNNLNLSQSNPSISNNFDNTADSLYQVPTLKQKPTSRNSGGGNFLADTSFGDSDLYQVLSSSESPKVRSQTLPVNGKQNVEDVYDNHNLVKNQAPLPSTISENNTSSLVDLYGNVNLTNTPLDSSSSYDNVNITNKPTDENSPSATESYYETPRQSLNDTFESSSTPSKTINDASDTVDSYYQAPPTAANDTEEMLKHLRSKSVKQQRTTKATKRDTSLGSINENLDNNLVSHENAVQQEIYNVPTSIPFGVKVEQNHSSSISEEPLTEKHQNDPNAEGTSPIAKPRNKVKQQRTSVRQAEITTKDRSVSAGYRMTNINNENPLDETYEWNKVKLTLYARQPHKMVKHT